MTDSQYSPPPAPTHAAAAFAPPSVPEVAPLTYDHSLSHVPGWWRGLLAIITFVVGFFIVSTVLGAIAIGVEMSTGAITFDEIASGVVPFTPLVMLLNNLSLAACIPLAMLLQRAFFGVPMRSLSSVVGRFRWRWMGRLALIIVPVWIVYVGCSLLLEPGGEVTFDGGVLLMLAIVVITTPLQSAGEEYGARGLILRSAASWFRSPWLAFAVGVVISSSLFSLAHFAADWWLIAYYFVFGASAALAARGTGGLEAPVLIHATNNVLLFIPAVLFGQLAEGIDRSEGTGGPFMLIPMALCLAAAGLSTWWARRNKVTVIAPPPARIVKAPPVQQWMPPVQDAGAPPAPGAMPAPPVLPAPGTVPPAGQPGPSVPPAPPVPPLP